VLEQGHELAVLTIDCFLMSDVALFLISIILLHYAVCTTAVACWLIRREGQVGVVKECYIIIRGGLQNCYITLYEGGGVIKSTFLRYIYIIYGRPHTF